MEDLREATRLRVHLAVLGDQDVVHLGVRLFDRGVIPLRLTSEGRERLMTVETILLLMDNLSVPHPTTSAVPERRWAAL